jgi:DNA-binding phage protein
MKRQAKRSDRTLSPEMEKKLRIAAEKILREEKKELSANAREVFKKYEAARIELARTAQLLKAERELQGLSLADMQRRTGIDRAVLCRLENLVDANPTVATLERIAHAMGKRLIVGLQD